MFKNVDPKQSFPKMEESILEFWNQNDIFKKSVENRPIENTYTIYDGPPFATGHPHYGHLVPGTIKDIIPRYQTMKGKRVPRTFGWDCHGLPVENEMKKKIGISSRKEIEEYGVDKYNEECRSIVMRFTSDWKTTIHRMGRWVDFENGYKTMDVTFMESIWWVFKTLFDKGLIYKGYNILPYSPGLGCPLSNMEVNLGGYKNVTDPAVTIRFKVEGAEDTYFLAWTTTPWTLPSNLALALGPEIDYVKLLDKESGDKYILGKNRISSYYQSEEKYKILQEYKGKELAGMRYEPLFPYFKDLYKEGAFVTVLGDYVTTDDGCGIVHTAPGFGEDDYKVLLGTGIPVVCPIDDECKFTSEVSDYEGIFVKDADKLIIARLKEEGKLVKRENYLHSYPFCWRTGAPLIYRAMDCWYVNIQKIKGSMVANNQKITWVPEHLKDGRFGKWLEGARDWAISRNRFWGNPIPVWKCDGSDYIEVIGSIAELEQKCGQKVTDLHKHYVDKLTWPSPDGKGTMRRVPDVLDCWFESGSMPYCQKHYPFENKEEFERTFPADFICEGLDQTRGWFYTLTIMAAALFDKPAFMHNITNGIILAEDGEKMSKSKGNFTDPMILVNTYGADALRFALMNSAAVHADDVKFADTMVKDVLKTLILPLWNSYSFFVTYANLDNYTPSETAYEDLKNPLDIWMISTLEALIHDMDDALGSYDIQRACGYLVTFMDSLNNWYIRRSRRRFWKGENDGDKKAAYDTLYKVLMTYIKLASPIIPYITEEIYLNLKGEKDPESVHLCDYPVYCPQHRDYELEDKMSLTVKAITMGRALRSSSNIKNRQPLKKLFLVDRKEKDRSILASMEDIIAEELNVKEVEIESEETSLVEYSAKANFKVLGAKLGKSMKEVASKIQVLSSSQIGSILDGNSYVVEYGENQSIELSTDDLIVQRSEKANLKILNEGDLTIGFDTEVTQSLLYEGIARDMIRGIQNLRKESGFEVSDRIILTVGGDEDTKAAYEMFKAFIETETLSTASSFDNNIDVPENEFGVKIVVKKA
ncbi:MAG: isoleucine--tRNA ligase [Sphaerochaetaceae bacterium]|nr:isoleucine--tRNA ligase [Sphaerochaetaceae bacterium]